MFRFAKTVLTVSLFGVYSAPLATFAYPVSKANSSNWNNGKSDETPIPLSKPAPKQEQPARDTSSQISSSSSHSNRLALSPGTHNISLGVGQVFLMGDFTKESNHFDNTIGTQIQYTYGVSDLFSFEANFGFSSHSYTPTPVPAVNSGSLSSTHLIAGLRTNLIYFDQLVPFFSGGLGFYRPSVTLASSGDSKAGILFGLNLGVGADLLLNDRIFFGTRLTYHDMFSSIKTETTGTVIGGALISFLVHAGVSF